MGDNWMAGSAVIGASIGIEKKLDLIHKDLDKLILVLADLVELLNGRQLK
jgi:hypothetical protein